jgi:hypothetical protein
MKPNLDFSFVIIGHSNHDPFAFPLKSSPKQVANSNFLTSWKHYIEWKGLTKIIKYGIFL